MKKWGTERVNISLVHDYMAYNGRASIQTQAAELVLNYSGSQRRHKVELQEMNWVK